MVHEELFKRKRFYSKLFRRYIEPGEYDFFERVHAELLYRIREMERVGCETINCKMKLDEYYEALNKYEKIVKPVL